MIKQQLTGKLLTVISTLLICGVGIGIKPKPVISAERLVFPLPLLGDFTLSVESLEIYAKEGRITKEFEFYAKRLDEQTLIQMREILQKRFDVDAVTVYRATNMPMGEIMLKRLGRAIQTNPTQNGFYALRSSLIEAAGDEEEGLTLLNVMRRFPSQDIRLNVDLMLELTQQLSTLFAYRDTSVEAIAQQATLEASQESPRDYSTLPDLRQTGSFPWKKKTISFNIRDVRQTQDGLTDNYSMEADIYLPETDKPAPLVLISHGFGAYKENNTLAEHLASHGFAVAVPEHVGSDLSYRKAFLQGEVRILVSPIEYISRPRDFTYLLDELEKLAKNDPEWEGKIDFDKIGVTGNSFGGATVLSLAGAEIDWARLQSECERDDIILNSSKLLQCRAAALPPGSYNLKDNRIKAAIAAHPLTSAIFGPMGMNKVDIPTLMVAGSKDLVTPVIEEQIHPFIWLETEDKYLTLLDPGTHFSTSLTSDTEGVEGVPEFLIGDNYDLGRPYFFGLNVAFFQVYLAENEDFLPYLTAGYGKYISEPNLGVNMIRSLTPIQLEKAYGGTPPEPIIPEPAVAILPQRQETVLTEIKRTGILKVALRRDAAPFGYINEAENQDSWTGYCADFINGLADELEVKLDLPIEVVELPSNLENRFKLVQNETVHLECGPNTIRDDVKGVAFSNSFMITGTHLLVEKSQASEINPNRNLAGVRTGILENTTTEEFIRQRYPEAKIVEFEGETGTETAVQALTKGEIDGFADDGILLIGEVVRQELPIENFTLVPKQPLTCEFYGMILPEGDREWQTTINNFLQSESSREIWDQWFSNVGGFPYVLLNLDYCVNRK